MIQNDKLVFNKVDTNTEKIIFFLFTIFFIFIVFTQMSISKSFMVNDSVKTAINDMNDAYAFEELQTLDEFEENYKSLVKLLYEENHYGTYAKTENEKYAFNNFNFVVSSVRLTQRRMKLEENKSEISKRFIKYKWAGSGIEFDDKQKSFEYKDSYIPSDFTGYESPFTYNEDMSYEGLGGYVINLNIYDTNYADNLQLIEETMAAGWLDDQTASLALDFVIYNPYLEVLMYTRITVKVEASGRLKSKVRRDALKESYYDTPLDVFRAICECLFLIICFFYIFRKGYEIYQEYLDIQAQFQKAERKKKMHERETEKKKKDEERLK